MSAEGQPTGADLAAWMIMSPAAELTPVTLDLVPQLSADGVQHLVVDGMRANYAEERRAAYVALGEPDPLLQRPANHFGWIDI